MKFRPCPARIVLALPVLGTLMAPTSAAPIGKDGLRPDKTPLSLETVREKASNPSFHYAEVPVDLKEGTAVPEPALIPNQLPDDAAIDRVSNHEALPPHGAASTTEDRQNASENAEAEQEPYEAEDIASIEKRGAPSSLIGEDEEFTRSVQPAPSIPEEEQPETQAELDNPAFEEESNYVQKNGEKRAEARRDINALIKHTTEEWESSQSEGLEENRENSPNRKYAAEPASAAKSHEPIPEGHLEVPISPDNTTTTQDVDNVDIDAHPQSRSKPAPTVIGDTPEALFHPEAESPEEHLERRTTHRLTTLDIKADEPATAAAPEASATEPEASASLEVAFSTSHVYTTPAGHARISRPVIQN